MVDDTDVTLEVKVIFRITMERGSAAARLLQRLEDAGDATDLGADFRIYGFYPITSVRDE